MKKLKARIPCGNAVLIQEVELFTVEEAKEMLKNEDWYPAQSIYSTEVTNQKIGWIAEWNDGKNGIYVEYR